MSIKFGGEFDGEPSDVIDGDGNLVTNSMRFDLKVNRNFENGGFLPREQRKKIVFDMINLDWPGRMMTCDFVLKEANGTIIHTGKLSGADQANENGYRKMYGTTDDQENVEFVYAVPECDCDDGNFVITIGA